jgi:hypothetical protein
MDTKTANPLLAHFRQPAIYYKLPSLGAFWPTNSIDLPTNSDIPIYPMTAKDEITLRTPDALLNGQGVIDVIHSCCPNIKNAWNMPSVDVDALLIAIRIASYGNAMTMDTKCPHCNEENTYEADLSQLLDGIICPDYNELVKFHNIQIKLKPQEYSSINATNQINYEQQRVLNTLGQEGIDDETRLAEYKKHMQRIVDLNVKILVDSTEYIEILDSHTRVSNTDHVQEYYQNCEAEICKIVRARLDKIGQEGAIPPMPAECQSCNTGYNVPLIFDYANFFGNGS